MEWYLKVLRQFKDFSGRARRKEYWMFVLFNIVFGGATVVLDNMLGLAHEMLGYGPIYGIYMLLILIPAVAVSVRRLHDIGKSGWMILVGFIPLIGGIWLIILFATDGQPGSNKWGPNPKEI